MSAAGDGAAFAVSRGEQQVSNLLLGCIDWGPAGFRVASRNFVGARPMHWPYVARVDRYWLLTWTTWGFLAAGRPAGIA